MSDSGDSGSIILDNDFTPVALIWGKGVDEDIFGPDHVTFASPLSKVMRDMEKCIGWEEGSVLML
jgi:hypothetical protein